MFNSKKQGELDFVIELDGKVCPIEIKSGKDYKRHRAWEHVLEDANYEIEKAFIFSDQNTLQDGRKCYLPIYLLMFVEETKLSDAVYKIDLRGL